MSPLPMPEATDMKPPSSFARLAPAILWPAFLVAGVLEILVFAVVDPGQLHWFGNDAIEWSSSTVYGVTFLIFWGAIALAGALTQLLLVPPETLNRWHESSRD